MSEKLVIQELNDYLNHHVPLFAAMQGQLQSGERGLRIAAPLAPNINDKGIAFGGAMAALAALTGWALTRTTLQEHGEMGEIVIIESTQKFLRPLRGDIVTEGQRPDAEAVQRFMQRYRQHGKARWTIDVVIHADGQPAMTFTGQYGAFRGA